MRWRFLQHVGLQLVPLYGLWPLTAPAVQYAGEKPGPLAASILLLGRGAYTLHVDCPKLSPKPSALVHEAQEAPNQALQRQTQHPKP